MTQTMCAARGCTKPVQATMLCDEHLASLIELIRSVPWMIEQLRVAFSRQSKLTTGGGSSTDGAPVLFNAKVSDATLSYANALTTWQRRLADRMGEPVVLDNPIAASMWMWHMITTRGIATWVDAGHMLDALTKTHERALVHVNRQPDKWFAGQCSALVYRGRDTEPTECDQDLYADAETGELECPRCGTKHDIASRRITLLKHADMTLMTATEAARAIHVLSDYNRGEAKLAHRIVVWNGRGLLEQHGTIRQAGQERPLYLVGEVRKLIADDEERQLKRAEGDTPKRAG